MPRNSRAHAKGKRVWVLYHWLGHYRQAVCEELIANSPNEYEFWGSIDSFDQGIRTVTDLPGGRFHKTKTYRAKGLYPQPGAVWKALVGRYDVAIIHAGGRWPTMWLAALIARIRFKRVLFWTQGWIREDSAKTALFKKVYFRLAHGLLLYGHYGKCLGVRSGVDPERLHVIYNSLDVESQVEQSRRVTAEQTEALRAELFPGREDIPIVTTVSRLTPPKRLELLIQACHELEQSGKPVNVLIAGDGPLRDELEEQAARLGVTVVFVGAVYEESRIAELLAASRVGVVPGPIGLFVMHAMIYGLPVVSNNSFEGQGPEFEAIVPGVTGDFFENGDASDLARVLRAWVQQDGNAEERRRVATERILDFYHPSTQRAIIDRAVAGESADDLVMAKWNRDAFLKNHPARR